MLLSFIENKRTSIRIVARNLEVDQEDARCIKEIQI